MIGKGGQLYNSLAYPTYVNFTMLQKHIFQEQQGLYLVPNTSLAVSI